MLQVRVELRDKLNKSIVRRGIFRKQKSFSGDGRVATGAFLGIGLLFAFEFFF